MNTNLNHESPQKTNFKSGILLVLFFLTTLFRRQMSMLFRRVATIS